MLEVEEENHFACGRMTGREGRTAKSGTFWRCRQGLPVVGPVYIHVVIRKDEKNELDADLSQTAFRGTGG